ncbi:MAG TPA: hypothetical protein PLG59_02790 [bacterium]|nr:hypothetical protein [bacterium]HQO33558.1 hypothetical protein [bacterium]HQP96924.1 hypothetical protein [bacterium]
MKMKMLFVSFLPAFVVLLFPPSALSADTELQVNYAPSIPMGVIGSFYTDAVSKPSSIEEIKSWGNYLYLAVRYMNGDQKLEIWDVRNPASPYLKQVLNYGNILTTPTDHWLFPHVNVLDSSILIRSNFSDKVYHHNELGELVEDGWYDFAEAVAEMKNNEESLFMSVAGSFGTFFGRLFDPYEVLPEEEYGYAVLNFANPRHPFVANLVPSVTDLWFSEAFAGHLNGALGNIPGNIRIDANQITFSGRQILAKSQFDVFWKPRLDKIFNTEILDRTVRDHIETIVKSQPYAKQFTDAIDRYFRSLQVEADRTLEGAIRQGYGETEQLKKILDDYDIDINESVRSAVRKIVAKELSLTLEQELSVQLFSPLLENWTDNLFAIPSFSSKTDMLQFVSSILNEQLDAGTVARYVLDNYIAPYVDTPDWMHWTMEEFVDEVVKTEAAQAVSVIIGAAHTTATADGFLEIVLSFVPEAKKFYLPVGFPEDVRDVLEYAFFEHGAKLNRKGLAFMEMLKFYQYYNGNDDYLNYENELSQAIRQVQEQLAGTVVDTIEPFLDAVSFAGDLASRIDEFSKTLLVRDPISLAITDSIVAHLESSGVDVDLSVHEACLRYRLYLSLDDAFGIRDEDLAKVEDFLGILREQVGLGETQIKTYWDEGKNNLVYIEKALRESLVNVLQETWGEIDLDIPMAEALYEFIEHHIDYRWTFGQNMDDLFQEFVYSALTEYPGYIHLIGVWDRAVGGDVMARWQATFEAAKFVAAALEPTGSLSLTYEGIELALQESYELALGAASKSLLMEFASIMMGDMYGGFSKWATATGELGYTFDAGTLSSLVPVRTAAFAWENRIGFLPREDWDYLHPRKMSLILLNPLDPSGEKVESVLQGGWGDVNCVHACEGVVMIGGTLYDGIWPKSSAMFLALEDNYVDVHTIEDYRLSSAGGILTANHGATLVVYGPGGVFLFPNPRTLKAGTAQPGTEVKSWRRY